MYEHYAHAVSKRHLKDASKARQWDFQFGPYVHTVIIDTPHFCGTGSPLSAPFSYRLVGIKNILLAFPSSVLHGSDIHHPSRARITARVCLLHPDWGTETEVVIPFLELRARAFLSFLSLGRRGDSILCVFKPQAGAGQEIFAFSGEFRPLISHRPLGTSVSLALGDECVGDGILPIVGRYAGLYGKLVPSLGPVKLDRYNLEIVFCLLVIPTLGVFKRCSRIEVIAEVLDHLSAYPELAKAVDECMEAVLEGSGCKLGRCGHVGCRCFYRLDVGGDLSLCGKYGEKARKQTKHKFSLRGA